MAKETNMAAVTRRALMFDVRAILAANGGQTLDQAHVGDLTEQMLVAMSQLEANTESLAHFRRLVEIYEKRGWPVPQSYREAIPIHEGLVALWTKSLDEKLAELKAEGVPVVSVPVI